MKQFFIFCSFFLALSSLNATHNRAGEILYKRIAPFTQPGNGTPVFTYSITVIKYLDDGQAIADRCVDTVYFGDGQKGTAPRINSGATCSCGSLNGTQIGCGAIIVSTPSYRVKYSVYSIIHTYAGPGTYIIRSTDFNRNQGVHNIPNSVNVPFYLESMMMIHPVIAANSSPVLTNAPVDQATLGVCFQHNLGAVDADGDSLTYEISTCRDQTGSTAAGYFDPELGPNGTFSISQAGILSWCSPQFIAEYNIAILVKEWRYNANNVLVNIGSVLRDMQVLVKYGVVGINENTLASAIKVSPNPFHENLKLDLGSNTCKIVETSLYSNDGKLVYTSKSSDVTGSLALPLGNLDHGIYLLCVKTESGVFYRKVVRD